MDRRPLGRGPRVGLLDQPAGSEVVRVESEALPERFRLPRHIAFASCQGERLL